MSPNVLSHPTGLQAQRPPHAKGSITQGSWSRASLVSAVGEVTELVLKDACREKADTLWRSDQDVDPAIQET